jgi:hypothetical protein
MYCISSVCCGGESASTASFILLSGQPVKALVIVRSSNDNEREQGGWTGDKRNKRLEQQRVAQFSRT